MIITQMKNEDVAFAFGTHLQALLQALGDRKGINPFGDFSAPLDEALIHVSLDLSGRPHLSYNLDIPHSDGWDLSKLRYTVILLKFQMYAIFGYFTPYMVLKRSICYVPFGIPAVFSHETFTGRETTPTLTKGFLQIYFTLPEEISVGIYSAVPKIHRK
ncbi:imidazoleglycerol-phosphate dehydratase [Medicago truncatula]|uniref:Imidazoleglycerol-phosphate dehydratase n=1 Tax=Medicago truncatula TaxID=3880 RepID=A0A072TP46_MEDTR|nr:imidazoleglycerol-phosphate dehydratase [Medicago truncatula]